MMKFKVSKSSIYRIFKELNFGKLRENKIYQRLRENESLQQEIINL